MKHTQGENSLYAGNLIMVEFHRVDSAAAVLVVLGIGAKYTGQKNLCPAAKRVNWMSVCHVYTSLFRMF